MMERPVLKRRKPQVQVSGFQECERKAIEDKVNHLGGFFLSSSVFLQNATHIICDEVSRKEKFLCGCASGKWLLTVDFINQSFLSGKWLDEEDFEWTSGKVKNASLNVLAKLPRHYRLQTAEGRSKPFFQWNVLLIMNHSRRSMFKRLLEAGGANIMRVKKPWNQKTLKGVKYAFVEEGLEQDITSLSNAKVTVLPPCCIVDMLIEMDDVPSLPVLESKVSVRTRKRSKKSPRLKPCLSDPKKFKVNQRTLTDFWQRSSGPEKVINNKTDAQNLTPCEIVDRFPVAGISGRPSEKDICIPEESKTTGKQGLENPTRLSIATDKENKLFSVKQMKRKAGQLGRGNLLSGNPTTQPEKRAKPVDLPFTSKAQKSIFELKAYRNMNAPSKLEGEKVPNARSTRCIESSLWGDAQLNKNMVKLTDATILCESTDVAFPETRELAEGSSFQAKDFSGNLADEVALPSDVTMMPARLPTLHVMGDSEKVDPLIQLNPKITKVDISAQDDRLKIGNGVIKRRLDFEMKTERDISDPSILDALLKRHRFLRLPRQNVQNQCSEGKSTSCDSFRRHYLCECRIPTPCTTTSCSYKAEVDLVSMTSVAVVFALQKVSEHCICRCGNTTGGKEIGNDVDSVGQCENLTNNEAQKTSDGRKPHQLARPLAVMIEGLFQDKDFSQALEMCKSFMNPQSYLPATILQHLFTMIMEGEKDLLISKAFDLLQRHKTWHPTSLLRSTYKEAFRAKIDNESEEEFGIVWQLLRNAPTSMQSLSADSEASKNFTHYLLLQFFVAVLTEDFLHYKISQESETGSRPEKPLICQMVWVDNPCVSQSKNLRDIIALWIESLQMCLPVHTALLVLVAECCALFDIRTASTGFGEACISLVQLIAGSLIFEENARKSKVHITSVAFQALGNHWLTMRLADHLFGLYDFDSLDDGSRVHLRKPLSLEKVLKCYCRLRPTKNSNADSVDKTGTRNSERIEYEKSLNSDVKSQQKSRKVGKERTIDKRNLKGETKLHQACIKNQPERVRSLLAQGANPNTLDNAGWSPLHEACNHGHIACVEELLKSKDTDVLVTGPDGLSVLQDAVLNDRLKVAELLVKVGGCDLVRMMSSAGITAVDMCKTKEMRHLLMYPIATNAPKRKRQSKVEDSVLDFYVLLVTTLIRTTSMHFDTDSSSDVDITLLFSRFQKHLESLGAKSQLKTHRTLISALQRFLCEGI